MIIDHAEPEEEGFYLQLSKLFAVQGSRYESLNGDYDWLAVISFMTTAILIKTIMMMNAMMIMIMILIFLPHLEKLGWIHPQKESCWLKSDSASANPF